MRVSDEQIAAAESACRVDESIVRAALAGVSPSWTLVHHAPSGGWFRRGTLQAGFSVARYGDGRIWLHVSACGRTGKKDFYIPSWDEMKRVKNDFLGADRWAYSVLPDERHYVNHHPCVLHLFALMDRADPPALPDFTLGLGTL